MSVSILVWSVLLALPLTTYAGELLLGERRLPGVLGARMGDYLAGRNTRRAARLQQRLNDLEEALRQAGESPRPLQNRTSSLSTILALAHRYPYDLSSVQATKIGNIFVAAESRVWEKYRLDAVAALPKLKLTLPPDGTRVLAQTESRLSIRLGSALGCFWACAPLLFLISLSNKPSLRALAYINIPFLLVTGAAFYRASIDAAVTVGDSVMTVFDLYRFGLLRQLHLELPTNTAEERELNARLSRFLSQEPVDLNFAYESASAPAGITSTVAKSVEAALIGPVLIAFTGHIGISIRDASGEAITGRDNTFVVRNNTSYTIRVSISPVNPIGSKSEPLIIDSAKKARRVSFGVVPETDAGEIKPAQRLIAIGDDDQQSEASEVDFDLLTDRINDNALLWVSVYQFERLVHVMRVRLRVIGIRP